MSVVISNLIKQYEEAKRCLEGALSSEIEQSAEKISNADAEVASAFEALLVADLKSSQEVWIRTQFLLAEIRSNLDTESLVDRMTKTVEDDIFRISQRNS